MLSNQISQKFSVVNQLDEKRCEDQGKWAAVKWFVTFTFENIAGEPRLLHITNDTTDPTERHWILLRFHLEKLQTVCLACSVDSVLSAPCPDFQSITNIIIIYNLQSTCISCVTALISLNTASTPLLLSVYPHWYHWILQVYRKSYMSITSSVASTNYYERKTSKSIRTFSAFLNHSDPWGRSPMTFPGSHDIH